MKYDLTNQKFGLLTALYPLRKAGRAMWHCRCDCGQEYDATSYNLRKGITWHCGCQRRKDLTNKKFNSLTALYPAGHSGHGGPYWVCRCDCGNMIEVESSQLTTGNVRSCGSSLSFRLPLMCYCAWFPTVTMPGPGNLPPEAVKEIILDQTSLANPESAIDTCFSYWSTKYPRVKVDRSQFQKVVDTLCPHFHVVPKMKTRMEEMEASYIQLTRQQSALLDFLEEQRTAVIHGLAGTGKTVLALEKAKRIASQDESVLFLCYNSFLRDMLKKNNAIPNVTFHNVHSLSAEVMGITDAPIEDVLTLFEDYLEEVFDSDEWHYRNIIIDEGQDLDDRLLNTLFELVKATAHA